MDHPFIRIQDEIADCSKKVATIITSEKLFLVKHIVGKMKKKVVHLAPTDKSDEPYMIAIHRDLHISLTSNNNTHVQTIKSRVKFFSIICTLVGTQVHK